MTFRTRIGWGILALWAPLMIGLIGTLMVDHVLPLPEPGHPDAVRAALADAGLGGGPRALHVIDARCSCTQRLLTHLADRGPRADVHESVLFVGEGSPEVERVAARGFPVRRVTREALVRDWALNGAPVLVAVGPAGELTYLGGYYRYPAALHPQDGPLLDAVTADERPRPLPVFGCAVDPAIAAGRDPWGLRTWLNR